MTTQQEIFKLALKQHPLTLVLVVAGLKPSSHCLVKVPSQLVNKINNRFKYQKISGFNGVGFYVFPRWLSIKDKSDKFVQLMIFNDSALQDVLSILNKNQSSFEFKNGKDVRLTNICFYKLARTKKNWSPLMKQDVTVVCGLSFGFPERSVLKFGVEVLMEDVVTNRKVYSVKNENNLVFIGYPETKKEAKSVITKWSNFKKTNRFKKIINQLNSLKF